MQQEILNLLMETGTINAGAFQEYDYNNEYGECKWRHN